MVDSKNNCACCCHTSGHVEYTYDYGDKHEQTGLSASSVPLSDDLIRRFKLYDTRNDHHTLITSIDWDQSGDCLLSCCRHSTVTLHSLSRDTVRHLYSRKHGAQGGRFVQGGQTHCIVAAKPSPLGCTPGTAATILESLSHVAWDRIHNLRPLPERRTQQPTALVDRNSFPTTSQANWAPSTLRHWDLQENRFIKTFQLPAPVGSSTQLSVSQPTKELICASCVDGCVRFFTLEKEQPLAVLESGIRTAPQAAIAPSGHLAAVQILPFTIQLLDFRKGWKNMDYLSIDIDAAISLQQLLNQTDSGVDSSPPNIWSHFFRLTNLQITEVPLASLFVTVTDKTTRSTILQFDMYTGALRHSFRAPNHGDRLPFIEHWKIGEQKQDPDFCFDFTPDISSDGRYMACGSGPDAMISIWSIQKGGPPIKTLSTIPRIARRVQWNPAQLLLASACDHLCFWAPSREDTPS